MNEFYNMSTAVFDCATTVRWPVSSLIKKFSSYQFLASDEFSVLGSDVSFRLELELIKLCEDPNDSSFLYLSVRDFNDEESVKIRFKIWMETSKGNKLTPSDQEIEEDISMENCNERLYYDIKNSDLAFFFERYPADTVLLICCEVRLVDPVPRLNESYSSAIEFRKNLWVAHNEGLNGYCTIEAEDKKFSVAKDMLMSQSKVFERMFSSNSVEAEQNLVKIVDVRADVIQALISYLYLGKPQNFEHVASELFVFADKYGFDKLKGQCLQYLIQSMAKENIILRLVYAFFYDNSVLKTRVLEYIKLKSDTINVHELVETDDWHVLVKRNATLANEIEKGLFEILN